MPSQYMWKDRLESFLEDNYSNPDLKFEDIMHYFRFSKTYGYELFKKYFEQFIQDVPAECAPNKG